MSFSTDRDLLAFEPEVFNDIPFTAQQRVHLVDGVMTSGLLSSPSADFANAQVDAGCVVLIDNVAHEVLSRFDAQTLQVSRLRNKPGDPAIVPPDGTGLSVTVRTFAPQAELVGAMLLRLLGIDDNEVETSETRIVSLSIMNRLEVYGVLDHIYYAAVNIAGDDESLIKKATWARDRFHNALNSASVVVDHDGDGRGDVTRRFGIGHLRRV